MSEAHQILRVIPIEEEIVFPNMRITITLDQPDTEKVVLVPRHNGEFLEIGVIAEVTDTARLPGGGRAVMLLGLHRARLGAARTDADGTLKVEVEERCAEGAQLLSLCRL